MAQETTSTYGELVKGVGVKFGPTAYKSRGADPEPKGLEEKQELSKNTVGRVKFSNKK